MSCEEIFISFTSKDYVSIFPTNNGARFTFKLEEILILEKLDQWYVSLVDFYNRTLTHDSSFIICLDGVTHSVVGQQNSLPCIERFPKNSSLSQSPLKFRLTRQLFETLIVYIIGEASLIDACSKELTTVQILFEHIPL